MSTKTSEQKRARKIQAFTGWSYSESLRVARQGLNPQELCLLLNQRGINTTEEFLVENKMVRKKLDT